MLTTKSKIKIASVLSRIVRTTRTALGSSSDYVVANRHGIAWRLDLKEGIDFAIFLGLYERSTFRALRRWVQRGSMVVDAGANVGAHTLELARQVGPTGKVFAFEPTFFAHSKLLQNLALNPGLADIVVPEQVMLAASDNRATESQIYSSWPLALGHDLHEKHLGRFQTTEGARAISLDTYLRQVGVSRLDFIKLDVDGFECEVLEGAQNCLEKFQPTIIMELAPYCLRDHGGSLERLVDMLFRWGYRFTKLNGEELPNDAEKLDSKIADGATINVIARIPSQPLIRHSKERIRSNLDLGFDQKPLTGRKRQDART
jgi:FkbM family methyltransferase